MNENTRDLARHLFERLVQHQNNPNNQSTRPRLYPSGFVFDEADIEKWLADHNGHENNFQKPTKSNT